MGLPVQPPSFQNPPAQYSPQHLAQLILELNSLVQRLNALGALRGTTLNLAQLPDDPTGLAVGDVYVDPVTGHLLVVQA